MEPGDPEQPGGARHEERKVRRNLDRLAAMKMETEELVERNGEEVGSSVYRAYVAAIVGDVCTVGMLDSGNTFHTVILYICRERLWGCPDLVGFKVRAISNFGSV